MHQETAMPIRPMKAVPVGQAVEVESAMPLTILMRTHLWVSWTRIAIDQEAMANAARQELVQAAPEERDGFMLQREADAALVAICAAAFALEAFTRELDELITPPPATQAAWQRRPPSADRQVLELLKLAVDPRGLVTTWTRELAWLFGVRGAAVHYEGVNEPSRPHPVGINVSVAQVTYSPENATRAVDLLVGILERCRDRPKPPVQGWSRSIRHALDELISRRSQAD
jgi:hypothetical protein